MSRLAAALAALLLAAAQAAPAAAARPFTVDDLLRVEGLGQTLVSPDGRWLAVERRRAYETASRFDLGAYTDLARTSLALVDLRAPGPPQPLFPHEPGVGYALGPFSPDGRRVVVYRLRGPAYELGVAEPARRRVTWSGLTPELLERGRAVAWSGPHRLVALTLLPGLTPFPLRAYAPTQLLAQRWAVTATGGTSVSVIGSGRYAGVRPRDPPSRVTVLDLRTGKARTLAEGAFEDLELSASGRWAALLEAGEDVAFQPDRPMQADYGLAKRRLRLKLLDLSSGAARAPCEGCDVMGALLAWSPAAEELLVFARRDGEPWPAGRLLRISPAGQAEPVAESRLVPVVGGRPETVRAGWMGADPMVLARAPEDPPGRADWWRVAPDGTRRLTGGLATPPAEGLVVTPHRLVLAADGALRVRNAEGAELSATSVGPYQAPVNTSPVFPRFGRILSDTASLVRTTEGPSPRIVEVGPHGPRLALPAPAGAVILAHAPGGGALLRVPVGGADRLVWQDQAGAHALAVLNPHLEDVDLPDVRPIRHAGPDGRSLISWLILPRGRADRPPPLVIWPYPGRAYAEPPPTLHPRLSVYEDPPRLLAAEGYAVLLPSLPRRGGDSVPSDGLAEDLLAVVEAANRQPELAGSFDPGRLGLWGHSFGGYAVIAAITQSDRFRVGVAAAAMPNLLHKWGDLTPLRHAPEKGLGNAAWTEDLQGDTRGPPWQTLDRFLRGSPLLRMDQARAPLLLVHGDLDNFPLGGAEQAFSAYARQNRDALLATYWGEPHVLRSPGNLRDYYARALVFLDEHLGLTRPGPPGSEPVRASGAPRLPGLPPRPAAGRRPGR
jgi:dipeptidyl aminopeptidase/acylaminoacyl peptidase